MQNFILIVILAAVIGLAAWYVYRARKNGTKCIGCPNSSCPHKTDGKCSGHCGDC